MKGLSKASRLLRSKAPLGTHAVVLLLARAALGPDVFSQLRESFLPIVLTGPWDQNMCISGIMKRS